MKKFLTCLFLTLIILSICIVCSAAPEIKGQSALLVSVDGEQVIYSKNPEERVQPAELTKLMTAYTAYKIYGFETLITVPESIGNYDPSMKLKAGEQIKSGDLIKGMLMLQANDAAEAIVKTYGGSEKFVAKMNEYAKELGMKNTVFTNVTGKEDAKQLTTANDLLKLYRAYCKDKTLYSAINTNKAVVSATNLSAERELWSKNDLICRFYYIDYMYSRATAGVKSSTSYGGYSVVSTAIKGEREFICIVLNSVYEDGVNHAMKDATSLFEYGFNELKTVTVTKHGDLLYEAEVKNGKGVNTLLLCSGETVKADIAKADDVASVEKQIIVNEPVKAPVKKGDIVGKVVYTYNGNFVGEVELRSEENVKRSFIRTVFDGIGWFLGLGFVKLVFVIAVIIFAIIFVFSYIKAVQRRKRRRNRRRRYKKF